MKILSIKVDEIPKTCCDCMLARCNEVNYFCSALPDDINGLSGSLYDMNYRRSDCPLECENDAQTEKKN